MSSPARAPRSARSILFAAIACCALGGCGRLPDVLAPASREAARLADTFAWFTLILFAIWAAVMLAAAFALVRRRGPVDQRSTDPLALDPVAERRGHTVVVALAIATAVVVIALTGISFAAQYAIGRERDDPLVIRLTGHQWWWQVAYPDADPSRSVETANEIHVPVGRPVRIELESADVIHSFWVPALSGKIDLIPGQTNRVAFTVAKPGLYRGVCAEFCGLQHAHMGLTVVAEEREAFTRWLDAERASAAPPADDRARRGEAVFRARGCGLCHTVAGTSAGGRVGPDLTHVAKRRTLAAGRLPMSAGSIGAWIADPQGLKPGSRMPRVALSGADIDALVGYLGGLK